MKRLAAGDAESCTPPHSRHGVEHAQRSRAVRSRLAIFPARRMHTSRCQRTARPSRRPAAVRPPTSRRRPPRPHPGAANFIALRVRAWGRSHDPILSRWQPPQMGSTTGRICRSPVGPRRSSARLNHRTLTEHSGARLSPGTGEQQGTSGFGQETSRGVKADSDGPAAPGPHTRARGKAGPPGRP
jgi:hypothetical protein